MLVNSYLLAAAFSITQVFYCVNFLVLLYVDFCAVVSLQPIFYCEVCVFEVPNVPFKHRAPSYSSTLEALNGSFFAQDSAASSPSPPHSAARAHATIAPASTPESASKHSFESISSALAAARAKVTADTATQRKERDEPRERSSNDQHARDKDAHKERSKDTHHRSSDGKQRDRENEKNAQRDTQTGKSAPAEPRPRTHSPNRTSKAPARTPIAVSDTDREKEKNAQSSASPKLTEPRPRAQSPNGISKPSAVQARAPSTAADTQKPLVAAALPSNNNNTAAKSTPAALAQRYVLPTSSWLHVYACVSVWCLVMIFVLLSLIYLLSHIYSGMAQQSPLLLLYLLLLLLPHHRCSMARQQQSRQLLPLAPTPPPTAAQHFHCPPPARSRATTSAAAAAAAVDLARAAYRARTNIKHVTASARTAPGVFI